MQEVFNCILFNGIDLIENAKVTINNGIITSIEKIDELSDTSYFIMPCLIDAHTHINNMEQVNKMMKYGISSTFDVSASTSLINESSNFNIISSIDMAMGVVLNPKKYVEKAISNGAKYIKVLLFNSMLIGQKALKGIVEESHKRNMKVVVHATDISTYKQAIDCDVDIILHLPLKDELKDDLASLIASKGIYVVPTLVMMETFALSEKNGYNKQHCMKSKKQVETLYKNGVQILVGTDANIGNFAPEVSYGDSIYREINLLLEAGLPLIEVLKGATSKVCEAFNIDVSSKIQVDLPANLLIFNLENGKINVSYDNLQGIWINGKEIK